MNKEISRDEFDKLICDIKQIKNDINVIMANTQVDATISSLVHSDKVRDIIFSIAKNQRFCQALMICKTEITPKELAIKLEIDPKHVNRDIIKPLEQFLTKRDDGRNVYIKRISILDFIGFDTLAVKKYLELGNK